MVILYLTSGAAKKDESAGDGKGKKAAGGTAVKVSDIFLFMFTIKQFIDFSLGYSLLHSRF